MRTRGLEKIMVMNLLPKAHARYIKHYRACAIIAIRSAKADTPTILFAEIQI